MRNAEKILTVQEWMAADSDIAELSDRPVASQLEAFDQVGTGFGYIVTLVATSEEEISDPSVANAAIYTPPPEHLVLTSNAVFKIRGTWYVIVDDNLSDIAKGLIGIISEAT